MCEIDYWSVTSEISYDFSLYHLKLIFENNIPFF